MGYVVIPNSRLGRRMRIRHVSMSWEEWYEIEMRPNLIATNKCWVKGGLKQAPTYRPKRREE